MLQGYKERECAEDMKKAYFVSLLASPHLKKTLSAKDIYKGLHADEVAKADAKKRAEDEAYLQALFDKKMEPS